MWLLTQDEEGKFRHTEELLGYKLPPYAILSHRWGRPEDEVTYEDIDAGSGLDKVGYQKLQFCARQAAKDGLKHFWIDTCCIHRSNYTELTEALTSMFRWYSQASKCYVYMQDISAPEGHVENDSEWEHVGKDSEWGPTQQQAAFRASTWHTRGWTLQELLAPKIVEFFSSDGVLLGDKRSLERDIHEVTGIPLDALRGRPLSSFSIPERLSWAADRETTREEDAAYCLFGIFDLFMAPFYGEGKDAALKRLKRELTMRSLDWQFDELPRRLTLEAQEDERQRLFGKLSSVDPQPTHAHIFSMTAAGTGSWFLDGPFAEWLHDDQRPKILWLQGKSGAGKSVLISNAIENCKRYQSNSTDIAMGMYYCTFDNTTSHDPTAVFGSVATQLLSASPDLYRKHLTRLRDKQFSTATEFLELVKDLCGAFKTVFLFVDAVNESTHQREVLDALKQLLRVAQNVSLCLTSTLAPDEANPVSTRLVMIDPDGQKEDIDAYVKARCANSPALAALNKDLKRSIRETLQRDADGMFRYVQCQCDLLATQRTGKAVRQQLDLPAQSLNDVYSAILKRISAADAPYAREALMWLSFSPLTLEQLSDALALEEGSHTIDPERRLQPPEAIFDICQSLIAYDFRSRNVSIAHSTVLKFLTSDFLSHSKLKSFHFSTMEQNQHLLRKTLAYFLLDDLAGGYCVTSDELQMRNRHMPLLKSATMWPSLVRQIEQAGSQPDPAAFEQMRELFATSWMPLKGNFGAWLNTLWIHPEYDGNAYRITQPLYAAAACGMASVVDHILQHGKRVDIDALGGRFDSCPLQVAVYRRHCNVADVLLNRGANPNVTDSVGYTTLMWAKQTGCPGCVDALIRHGAAVSRFANRNQLSYSAFPMKEESIVKEKGERFRDTRPPVPHLPVQVIEKTVSDPRRIAFGDSFHE